MKRRSGERCFLSLLLTDQRFFSGGGVGGFGRGGLGGGSLSARVQASAFSERFSQSYQARFWLAPKRFNWCFCFCGLRGNRLRRVLPVTSQSIGTWQSTQKGSIRCRGISVGGPLPRPRS